MRFTILFCLFVFASHFSFSQTLSQRRIDSLVDAARKANSDGLVIWQNGMPVVEENFGQALTPTYIASVSKALVSIAIIKLLNDKKIRSIDQPVSDFYPEWKQGQKKDITLRMLLSHTSGLQNVQNSRLEIETGPKGSGDDLVKLALAAEITHKPGTVFSYNNKATCLLPGIIEVASGKRMDHYFEEEFFAPMKITSFDWKRDGTGRPQGHGGFMLLATDLAKFGQLMLNKGELYGKRYFDARWVDSSLVPSQQVNTDYGLIWNLATERQGTITLDSSRLATLTTAGVADSLVLKLAGLGGKNYQSEMELVGEMQSLFGPGWQQTVTDAARPLQNGVKDLFRFSITSSTLKGYYHTGSWGNYLVIYPELKLVAVRVVKRDKEYVEERDKMGGFVSAIFSVDRD